MTDQLKRIENEQQLDEMISRPTEELINMISQLDGDLLFLGVGGKIGVSMASMTKRAVDQAGVKKRVIGLDRFDS